VSLTVMLHLEYPCRG